MSNANFTPVLKGYTGQGAFRFWCQTVLPLVYDDSLSYYELLNKVVTYLNNAISDISTTESNVESLLDAYNSLQGYVNDYFNNLDIQNEINIKLDEMAVNGTLTNLIQPFLPAIVSDWLDNNITPTTPIVDSTLTISGAAADSKTVGDKFSENIARFETEEKVSFLKSFSEAPWVGEEGRTHYGVTFAYNSNTKKYDVTGTSTNDAFYLLSGNANEIPIALMTPLCVNVDSTNEHLYAEVFFYINGSLTTATHYSCYNGMTIIDEYPENTTGLYVRIRCDSGYTFNDSIGVSIANANKEYLIPVHTVGSGITNFIQERLEKFKYCKLGPGRFLISSIDMPEGSKLEGSGASTIVYATLSNSENGYGIKMSKNCTIEGIKLIGAVNDITLYETVNKKHGILIQGDYSTSGDADAQPKNNLICNCIIEKFTGGAITLDNTGTPVGKELIADNIFIDQCSAGINIAYESEFNKFSNIIVHNCTYGCVNNGGNNVFVNCDFSKNKTGFIIKIVDGSGRTLYNEGHGSCIGCVFNHIDYDETTLGKGEAIHIENCGPGFVFSSCQIFFGSIYIKDSTGIGIRGFNFGRMKSNGNNVGIEVKVETTDGSTTDHIFFSDCVFHTAPRINFVNTSGSGNIVWDNCYTRSGTPISNP